ncbi:PPOX class F420-dependent oxidoreductase [Actinobacteria bacterium YIM 96077]|uniref:PPOX class F420-dependent oxidoreductase n=1 Tax=Phytoactinopolyspora halophila TaxID=1981511 RepID=A0A329QJG0_9ACTN|nr:PPOX class F420-dependent oxidoreductase [Phytoactinopolyspora halophila]AYY13568.1 PPOX class F420-dependent oxidoreductase [Actinobacteria bacterium YIM 96077]RAW12376.1 PPOX class F420-dependent oxidoreductase [Phytoactinopolyspora halophila]
MSTFTAAEIEYVRSQHLGRLATVGADGAPHVLPVGVFYDPETETIVIGSAGDMTASKKFRDVRNRPDVAFVVDDLAAVDPWTPRGIEIRGRAEAFTEGGEDIGKRLDAPFPFDAAWIRIRPRRILTWGIDTGSYEHTARNVT